jgi:hypothetical protein
MRNVSRVTRGRAGGGAVGGPSRPEPRVDDAAREITDRARDHEFTGNVPLRRGLR